jgi:hypothetical protein
LDDGTKVEDSAADYKSPFHTETFDRWVAEEHAEEASCLESTDDVCS